jgi:antirestriction protein ArdC
MATPEADRPSSDADRTPRQPNILTRLEQAVGQIQDSDNFRAYLDLQAKFHKYSWSNTLLILTQRPDATMVAGYNAWLKMHRYVRRGEKGIRIIVPMRKNGEPSEDGENSGEAESRLFFGTGHVFDLSQTDGEPLPTVEVPVLQAEEGAELYKRLAQVVAAEQLELRAGNPDQLSRQQMGYYSPRERLIVVRDNPRLQMTKTLAHELAHHFAGHGAEGDQSPRDEQETVAESCSYVTLAHFGLDSGERSFPYVATWSREQTLLRQALGTIQKVSATLIERVEGRAGEGQPQLS